MQLNTPLYAALAAATASLLAPVPAEAADSWQLDSSLMVYDEADGVRSVSPAVEISRNFADEARLSLSLRSDTLTGASPSGASGAAQTVTSPSGTPVDIPDGSGLVMAPFEDQRYAMALAWDDRLDDDTRYGLGGAVSQEEDFTAYTASARVERSFWRNNLTLGLGLASEFDRLQPIGGTPLPFSLNGGSTGKTGEQQRRQHDLLLSASLVLSPGTLLYLSTGAGYASGYLTDPYKVITVVDPVTGEPVDGVLFDGSLSPNQKKANLYERRPDERTRTIGYVELKQSIGAQVFTADYRLTDDDWSITSHTLGLRWLKPLGSGWELEPELRWYQQSAAYFYRHSLIHYEDVSGPVMNVRYASADRRLSAFDALTSGLRLGWTRNRQQQFSLRVAHYTQQGESHPADAIGSQRQIDYFPRVSAWWAQLLVRLSW